MALRKKREQIHPGSPPGWIGNCRQQEIWVLRLDLASSDLRREAGRAYRRVVVEGGGGGGDEDAGSPAATGGEHGGGGRQGGERDPAARAGAAVRSGGE